ncbi:MAG: hypothetical protein AAFP10_01065 [Pseudomonadota bacterium]
MTAWLATQGHPADTTPDAQNGDGRGGCISHSTMQRLGLFTWLESFPLSH